MSGAQNHPYSHLPRPTGVHPVGVMWPGRHLKRAGLHPRRFIGKGFDGVVFELEPGFVVKATTCYAEASFFLWLGEIGGHPAFPKAVEVLQIGRWKGDDLYAVVREDVPDLQVPDPDLFYLQAERLPASGLRPHHVGGLSSAKWQGLVQEAILSARPEHAGPLQSLTDALTWALEAGCAFPRIHEGNLGMRGQQVVLRDLSRVYPPLPWYRQARVLSRVSVRAK